MFENECESLLITVCQFNVNNASKRKLFISFSQTTNEKRMKKIELLNVEVIESASRQIIDKIYKAADELRKHKDIYRPLTSSSRKPIKTICPPASDGCTNSCGNVITRFVEVGCYESGAVFGLGEQMEDRIILAKDEVKCLLVPRYWLFQSEQNLGNIWQR